ncbi:MAG: hypothetical protein GX284_09840 [Clostridiales bacterium]|nr:hypothetical protein [Clostridiales bacterium]
MDEGKGQLIGSVCERLSKKVDEKREKEVLGMVVGYVSVVGDAEYDRLYNYLLKNAIKK